MAADSNKKTLRHFYCRDLLWQSYEQMSEDMDRGVDDLVNEAMQAWAREQGYEPGEARTAPENRAFEANTVPARGGGRVPPPPPPPPAVAARRGGVAPGAGRGRRAPLPPPPPARSSASYGSDAGEAPTLYLVFGNQRYRIDKDQFIIGRGSKSSDLPIKDGNISRKHAAVIRRNGTYYIKDLGSTNGIDYKGMRIDNKRIDEGDIFHLCDYELRFTYRR